MGVRTAKGDPGITELITHKRVSKDSPVMCAIGDLDELNCFLGLAKIRARSRSDKELLERIQYGISVIASEIALGKERTKKHGTLIKKSDVDWLEGSLLELEKNVDLGTCFRVPGENERAACIDLARAVARRAERGVVALLRKEKDRNDHILAYLNCLSDILFVLANKKHKRARKKGPKPKRKAKK